jgi:Flp pilus assembly protein TadG
MFRRFRRRAPRPGQSVVEFAIVSLVLMMFIFGTVDLGRGVLQRQMLTNAVREAARYGSVVNRSTLTFPSTAATDCTAGSYCASVVAAAAKRSPSLNLTATNFASSGTITMKCDVWSTTASTANDVTTCQLPTGKGSRLTICANYQFTLTAPRLIGLGAIPMRECATVTLQ